MFLGFHVSRALYFQGLMFLESYIPCILHAQGFIFSTSYISRRLCSQVTTFPGTIFLSSLSPRSCLPRVGCSKGPIFPILYIYIVLCFQSLYFLIPVSPQTFTYSLLYSLFPETYIVLKSCISRALRSWSYVPRVLIPRVPYVQGSCSHCLMFSVSHISRVV